MQIEQDNNEINNLRAFYARLVRETSRNALRSVLEANQLPEHPTSASEIRPVPVFEEDAPSNLLNIVAHRTPTTILWPDVQADTYVPAYYKQFKPNGQEARNEIVVVAENYCQARFFAAKELMHGLIEDDNYPATNTFQLVNELIDELAAGQPAVTFAPQTIVDEVAWLGAAHYLIPNGWIPLLKKMVHDVIEQVPASTQHAYLHVARHIRVPEVVLRIVLKQPYYQDLG